MTISVHTADREGWMNRLSLLTLTPELAAEMMANAAWPARSKCPYCASPEAYALSTRSGSFKCKNCTRQYSKRERSLLSKQKIDDLKLVAACYAFSAAKKGISSPELSRIIGVQQCTAWSLLHKFREAIQVIYADVMLGGTVEVDGAFFGGHIRHVNKVEDGRSRRIGRFHYQDRRTVVVLKQRMGKTLTFVGKKEADASEFITSRIEDGAVIVVDQAHAWDGLIELYEMLRVNHKWAFSANRVNTNSAESYFAMLRRVQNGTYHRISGKYLGLYAQEVAWRLDHKESSTAEMIADLLGALVSPIYRASPPLAEAIAA